MKELTREETIKAVEACKSEDCANCLLYEYENCVELREINVLHHLKEKEPAPAATGTSPNVNPYKMYNTTKINKCQDLLGKSVKLIDTNNMRDIGEALAYIKIVAEMLSEED